MNFFKTSFWSALSTVIKIAAGIVTTKILATHLGPGGLGLFGNFISITTILAVFSNGAIGVGTTKYIAEYSDEQNKKNIIAHTLKITLFCSLLIGALVIIFHQYVARLMFGDNLYNFPIILFGFTLIFFGLNTSIIAIFNGYKQIKSIVFSGIVGSVISVILSIVLTTRYGMTGALVNASIAQIVIFLINAILLYRSKIWNFKLSSFKFKKTTSWNLVKFAFMSVVFEEGADIADVAPDEVPVAVGNVEVHVIFGEPGNGHVFPG